MVCICVRKDTRSGDVAAVAGRYRGQHGEENHLPEDLSDECS